MADKIVEKNPLIDVQALVETGRLLSRPIEVQGKEPIVLIPQGYTPHILEQKTPDLLPPFIRQAVVLDELESFIRYVNNAKKDETTVIFATITSESASFTAVFDYHNLGADEPERCAHRAQYNCPYSIEWSTWKASDKQAMGQETFCQFVDQNIVDILEPNSAELLELLTNFEGKSSVEFQSDFKRQSGSKTLKFVEHIDASRTGNGQIKVPEEFVLALPVFQGGDRYRVKARLLYRVNGGNLKIAYELHRAHEAVDAATKATVAKITEATGIAPLIGKMVIHG